MTPFQFQAFTSTCCFANVLRETFPKQTLDWPIFYFVVFAMFSLSKYIFKARKSYDEGIHEYLISIDVASFRKEEVLLSPVVTLIDMFVTQSWITSHGDSRWTSRGTVFFPRIFKMFRYCVKFICTIVCGCNQTRSTGRYFRLIDSRVSFAWII